MNNVTQNLQRRQFEAAYHNGRKSLLFLVILSAINIISVPVANIYFLFSALLPSLFSEIGFEVYQETGDSYYLIVFAIVGVLTLLPYVACWYFSKKHHGWMIGALVLFSIETVFVVYIFIISAISGEISSVLDVLLHAYVVYSLVQASRVGSKLSNLKEEEPYETQSVPTEEIPSDIVRELTLVRFKQFSASSVRFTVLLDGNIVCDIGNGETVKLDLPEKSVILSLALPDNSLIKSETIPEGTYNVSYNVSFKTGFVKNDIAIERVQLNKL